MIKGACSTPFGINGRITGAANRLSALPIMCSTPFGINGRITRHDSALPHKLDRVLNAFRHQRKDHLDGVHRCLNPELVLNAFRHQRKDHITIDEASALLGMCSTPFGINGRITPYSSPASERSRSAQRLSASTEGSQGLLGGHLGNHVVLNAFRHQRKDHELKPWILLVRAQCSTPFGINGRLTFDRDFFLEGIYLCSTPFGINGRITSSSGGRASGGTSAQRLSASTEGSLAGLLAVDGERDVLNALRHQRKDHSLKPAGFTIIIQCSTPFGINGRITEPPATPEYSTS